MKKDRSVKIPKELFDRSIKPLITVIFIKLGKFDRFFTNISIRLHDEVIENSLEKFLKIFSTKLYNGDEDFVVSFRYSGYVNETEANKIDLNIDCKIFLSRYEYTLSTNTTEKIQITNSYSEHLSHEEINLISDSFSNMIYSELEKLHKKK